MSNGGESVSGRMLDSESAQTALKRLTLSARRAGRMQELLDRLRRLSRGDQPVWISGELGAGRHSAALALHALSTRQTGPVLVLHGRELQPVLRLLEQPDPDSAEDAKKWLFACDEAACDGTLVIDEGGSMDLAVRGLFQDLLALALRTRLVLLTAEGALPAGPYQEVDLLGHLRPRHVRVPPLARRKDEIYALCQEALREQAGGDLAEDAAPLLAGRPWPGNLWQLRHLMARLGRGAVGQRVGAAELHPHLPDAGATLAENTAATAPATDVATAGEPTAPDALGVPDLSGALDLATLPNPAAPSAALDSASPGAPGPLEEGLPAASADAHVLQAGNAPPGAPCQAIQVAAALGMLLRPLVPPLPHAAPPEKDPQPHEVPFAPLLLEEPEGEPLHRHRLVLGPAPMDERRLVAALQARPLAASGPSRGIARTGDAQALARLGPLWRGNLLGLLRAVHREMDPRRAPTLSLLSLAHLLLVSGAPLGADALARLGLGLPVDLPEEATAILFQRARAAYEHLPAPASTPCTQPALGRCWADAVRDLLPQAEMERFQSHAETCDRCARLLLGWWSLVATLREAGGTRPIDDEIPTPAEPAPASAPAAAPAVGEAAPTPAVGEAAPAAPEPPPPPPPAPREPENARRDPSVPRTPPREPAPDAAPPASASASASARAPAAPVSTILTPGRWLFFAVLLLLMLVLGAVLGARFGKH